MSAPSHGGKTRVFLCGGDERLAVEPSDCPNVGNHEPHPLGYTDFHEWARVKNRTHKNSACPGCGLYTIWTERIKKPVRAMSGEVGE